ncbi:MAG: hypothetical protein J6X22_02785 [Muribaculaceae bacterium]|nr:hypothetical protein [Muribaculaceae bacterium]
MKSKVIKITLLVLLLFCAIDCSRDKNINECCGDVIEMIEEYKAAKGHLPESLDDIDFENGSGADEIYYELLNDSTYIISYIASEADHNKCYYSDDKKWYDGLRPVDNDTLYWKHDTCGCLKLRDFNMLDRIIDRYHLVGKDTAVIVEYLGRPNEIINIDNELQYEYFLDAECIGQNPENAAGRSWINLQFNNKFELIGKPDAICVE